MSYKYALLFVWIAVALVFSALRPDSFGTLANAQTIFSSQSVLAVLALALIFPLLVGEFDLSIGANLGLAAIIVSVLNTEYQVPVGWAIAVALAAGLAIGVTNAVFVVGIGVDGLVTTLGVGTIVAGVGYAVSNYVITSGVSEHFTRVVNDTLLGVPLSFWYGVALCLAIWYIIRYTPLGRQLVFVGAGREVARLSGIRVQAVRMGAFIACGLLSAVAGVMLAGTLGGADPTAGPGFLLPAYSAVFLGATVVNPGQFNPWGTMIAVYFLTTGIIGLQLLGLQDWIQDIFYGAALVIAVSFAHLAARRRAT